MCTRHSDALDQTFKLDAEEGGQFGIPTMLGRKPERGHIGRHAGTAAGHDTTLASHHVSVTGHHPGRPRRRAVEARKVSLRTQRLVCLQLIDDEEAAAAISAFPSRPAKKSWYAQPLREMLLG